MELEYELKKEELEEHLKTMWKEIDKGEMRFVVIDVVVWVILSVVYLSLFSPIDKSHIVLFFLIVGASGFNEVVRKSRLRSKVVASEYTSYEGALRLKLSSDGVMLETENSTGEVKWGGIKRADETSNLYRFFTGAYDAILVSKRCISDVEQFQSYFTKA